MENLFLLIFLLSILALIVGLIKPSLIKLETRKRVALICGSILIVSFILFGITAPPADNRSSEVAEKEEAQQISSIKLDIENDITTTKNSTTIEGKTEPGANVKIEIDGEERKLNVDESGKFSFTLDTKEKGSQTVSIYAEKEGFENSTEVVKVQKKLPLDIENDITTTKNSTTIEGKTEPGANVKIEIDGEERKLNVDESGKFSFTLDTKEKGNQTVSIYAEKEGFENSTEVVKVQRKLSEEEKIAAFKEKAQHIPYAQLKKNPDRYSGEIVSYTGKIVQIMEENDYTIIRLAVTKDSYGYDINDIVWVEYDGLTNFVEDDIITIYGTIIGEHTYTSQAGWTISVPAVLARIIE